MKKSLAILICLFASFTFYAQNKTETLLSKENSYGGFGGPIIEFSSINGSIVGDVGGGGAFVVNNFFVGGYGLGNSDSQLTIDNVLYDVHFGHRGFWLGYAIRQHKVVHLYTSFRVGWGKAELKQGDEKFFADNLLALAPELGLEVNVSTWFKFGITGGLRAVSGVDNLPILDDDDFTGFYGALTFRFGGFGDYDNDDDDIIDFN